MWSFTYKTTKIFKSPTSGLEEVQNLTALSFVEDCFATAL